MREKRLYYDQPYLSEFATTLIRKEQRQAKWFVELAQTAFYPTSGGQPNDLGSLNDLAVHDVVEEGETIWHVLDEDPGEGEMRGCIDWTRRYDFMQQHGGQHILSQAFWQRLQATTIGFHLTETTLTIDLDVQQISEDDVVWIEQAANQIVWSNRRILGHWCDDEQLEKLPLRKPPKVDMDIRVVEVEGYDWSPCGGTHPAYTAEIGLIKIRRWERSKGVTRVEFFCGNRALEDFRFKNQFALRMAADLSVKDRELPEAWIRQQALLRETDLGLRRVKEELLQHKVTELYQQREHRKAFSVVMASVADVEFGELKQMSQLLTAYPATVALLCMDGGSAQVALARSADLTHVNLQQVFKSLITEFSGKGGGTPQAVQGMIGDAARLEDFLRRVARAIVEE